MEDEIFSNLSAAAEKTKTFSVYKKSTMPAQYHYTNNRRVMPITVEAKENYTVICNQSNYHPGI
jgi:hypothetical protein